MIEVIVGSVVVIGLVSFVICLHKTNRKTIDDNTKFIRENFKFMHAIRTDLEIVKTTLKLKYESCFKKAVDEVNNKLNKKGQ